MTRHRLLVGLVLLAAVAGCAVAIAAAIGVTSASLGISTKTLSSEQTCTLSSAEDAQTMAGSPNSTNSDPSLITIYHQSDGVNTQDGFIKFSFSSCNFPANAVVNSATLQLTVQERPDAKEGGLIGPEEEAFVEGHVVLHERDRVPLPPRLPHPVHQRV